jgi:hypothetical protein
VMVGVVHGRSFLARLGEGDPTSGRSEQLAAGDSWRAASKEKRRGSIRICAGASWRANCTDRRRSRSGTAGPEFGAWVFKIFKG